MGVYNNVLITSTDREQRISSLVNYLNELEGITAEEYSDTSAWSIQYDGVLFSFDGTNIQGFYGYKNGGEGIRANGAWLKNGDIYIVNPIAYANGNTSANLSITSYIDEKCSIISICDIGASMYRSKLQVALVSVGDRTLVGYIGTTADQKFFDISTMTFEDISDAARIQYTYTNMFPYGAPPGTLDFLAQAYFVNGNSVKSFTSDLLKECSTVTLLSTVSLPSPLGNHLAIGAHCIVPLDEEEGGNE